MTKLPEEEFLKRLHPRYYTRTRQPIIWLVALAIGIIAGYATIGLRLAIDAVSLIAFGATEGSYLGEVASYHWSWRLGAPIGGGLIVGAILFLWTPKGRPEGVADIIEARALHSAHLSLRTGLRSAAIAAISLGTGASSGREGPAAHLGATLASKFAQRLGYPPRIARTLLGAGVAAAVAASFNAPIAGVLFALEVVLGHYAIRAFAPITIAAVAGALICRIHIGDMPAFAVPNYYIESVFEVPAFAMLGLFCALVSVLFIRSVQTTDNLARRVNIPLYLRPVIGGALVGLIGLSFPQVLGVGYGATDAALKGEYALLILMALVLAKIAATTVTIASRFGGGVFSPSLFIGAMTGGAFGLVAASLFPSFASESGLYAIIGMGAVAAAILGAPISTTLIVFELTGDYNVMIAIMIAASVATVLTQAIIGKSYFHMQLEERGLHVAEGPQRLLLETIRVEEIMTADSSGMGRSIDKDTPLLYPDDTLEQAFNLLEADELDTVLVVERNAPSQPIGYVYHKRALQIFNRALVDANIEEHR